MKMFIEYKPSTFFTSIWHSSPHPLTKEREVIDLVKTKESKKETEIQIKEEDTVITSVFL